MQLLQLYDEYFDAQPWDTLLALGVISVVAILPIAVAIVKVEAARRTARRRGR